MGVACLRQEQEAQQHCMPCDLTGAWMFNKQSQQRIKTKHGAVAKAHGSSPLVTVTDEVSQGPLEESPFSGTVRIHASKQAWQACLLALWCQSCET